MTAARKSSIPIQRLCERLSPPLQLCSALDPEVQDEFRSLDERLQAFYNSSTAERYFASAEEASATWTQKMKAHIHLKATVESGSKIVDLGCGTAHPVRNLDTKTSSTQASTGRSIRSI